jgi:3-hydroxyisobutyrate dehydrogenase
METSMTKISVGFIGLGDQGGAMVEMILAAGFPVIVWSRRPEAARKCEAHGALVAGSPSELGQSCELLCLCVTGEQDVREVLLEKGALDSMSAGKLIAIHSTILPATCVELAEIAECRNLRLLDIPVSGSGHAARARTLLAMVGGDRDALERVRPILESYAGAVVHLGGVGAAMNTKLLNNMLSVINIGQAFDILSLTNSLQVDSWTVREALLKGTARTFALELIERLEVPDRAAHILAILRKDMSIALAALPQSELSRWRQPVAAGLDALTRLASGQKVLSDNR